MAVQRKILAIVVSLSIILILFVLLLAYGYKRRLLKRYGPYLQTNLHFEVQLFSISILVFALEIELVWLPIAASCLSALEIVFQNFQCEFLTWLKYVP